MNNDDMMKLFHQPLQVRPEAVAEAARILDAHDQEALEKAAEKRLRKQLQRLNAIGRTEKV